MPAEFEWMHNVDKKIIIKEENASF
jgi:hypothetical protein